jgi:hypothetical protein
MDIDILINRKQSEADQIQASISGQQTDLDSRLEVIDRLRELKLQSLFSTEEVDYLFDQYNR